MIFTSFEYAFFFASGPAASQLFAKFSAEKWLLLVASYLFYMSWSIPCGFLILFTSGVDYFVGVGLGRIESEHRRKFLLDLERRGKFGRACVFQVHKFSAR